MEFTVKCHRIYVAASPGANEEGAVSAVFTDKAESKDQRVRLELRDIPSDLIRQINADPNYQLIVSLVKPSTNV